MSELGALSRRVGGMIVRGIVVGVEELHGTRRVQLRLRSGETTEMIECLEFFGATGRPVPGAEALCLSVGGWSDHRVAIVSSDARYRYTGLGQGDACLFDAYGHRVEVTATKTVVTGDDIRLGSSAATEPVALWTAALETWLRTHVHGAAGTPPTTSPPASGAGKVVAE